MTNDGKSCTDCAQFQPFRQPWPCAWYDHCRAGRDAPQYYEQDPAKRRQWYAFLARQSQLVGTASEEV